VRLHSQSTPDAAPAVTAGLVKGFVHLTPEKLQSLIAKVESGRVTKIEVLKLIADARALSKSKRELDSLKKTLETDEALKDAFVWTQCRQLMEALQAQPKPKHHRNLTPEEKRKRDKLSKDKYERLNRKLDGRKRTSLIEEQFGRNSFPAHPTLDPLNANFYTCLDEILRGGRIKMSDLEDLFGKERHRFKGCLPKRKRTSKRCSYNYQTVLKIVDNLLCRKCAWLSDIEIQRFLRGLSERASEIASQEAKAHDVHITPHVRQRLKAMGIDVPVPKSPKLGAEVNQAVQAFVKRHLARINSGK
jgi:hypothetical protein